MSTLVRTFALSVLTIGMFFYPQEVLNAAKSGLLSWWNFVLPALLPFFILSELLMAGGFVHFLGIILESFMRPVFRLPGKAAFVVAMGYTSGFPMGAVLTARLRQAGEITRVEGERLLAFTNNPSPGFMLGAVASGMLGNPSLGFVLAGSVYLANLVVGFLFRFYQASPSAGITSGPSPTFQRAWQEMKAAQNNDRRAFGQILSEAVKQSISTVLTVAGFMVFFSVILRLLNIWHVPALFAGLIHLVFQGIPLPVLQGLINGLLEMTIGCQGAVQATAELNYQVALLTFLMGWSGLSVFAQVAGFTSETDLRLLPFLIARGLQGLIALGLGQFFLRFAEIPAADFSLPAVAPGFVFWSTWQASSHLFIGIISFFLVLFCLSRLKRV